MWATDQWWVRLWDFPRVQIAAVLLMLIVALAALRPSTRWFWPSLIAGSGALLWQASHVAAYLPLAKKQVASAGACDPNRSISLLNANILQDNRDYGTLISLVERIDPDVVLLLETDRRWGEAVSRLYDRYPYRSGELLPNTYGILMLSKLPMQAAVKHRLQPDIPSIDAQLLLRSGETVNLFAVHPEPPLPGDDSGERDAELVMVGRDVRADGRASIVLGDLNDVAWSRTSRLFREVGGVGDPRVGRGLYPTFHAGYPLLRWPLDHGFVSPHWRLQAIDRLANIGADHFPMLYRFCLVRDPGRRLVPRAPEREVQKEAVEEATEGREEKREEDVGGE